MKKTSVPLKKVIKEKVGASKVNKYLSGLDFAYADSNDIYQGALANLINGNTERAIRCIIFGLDLDRDNNSIIHLSRTMLFSLSEDFYESGGDLYRQKFGSLEKSMIQISKKTEDISSKCEFNEEKISDLNKQLESNNSIIFKFFKKNNVKKEISVLEIELLERHQELQVLKNDMDTVTSLERIEEYIKILGIILEVCIFPARFAWAIEN